MAQKYLQTQPVTFQAFIASGQDPFRRLILRKTTFPQIKSEHFSEETSLQKGGWSKCLIQTLKKKIEKEKKIGHLYLHAQNGEKLPEYRLIIS